MDQKDTLRAGDAVVVNARTKRVVPYTPPAPGREPAPGRNDPLLHSASGWTKSMAQHYAAVCPPNLWRIHGELYDLNKYMDVHPGGRVFLEQSRGSDCTEAFECHHIRGVPQKLLDQHRVTVEGFSGKQITERFEYDKNFRAIKQFVAEYLENKVKNPTGTTPVYAGVMYMAVVLQFLLVARLAARRRSYPLLAVAAILMAGCWGVGHNQVHRGRKRNPWSFLRFAMDLTGFSNFETTVTHAMSHHQNPNLQYDIEVYNFQALDLYFLTNETKNSSFLYRVGLFPLTAALTAPFLYTTRVLRRVLLERDPLNADIVIPTALIAMMCREAGSVKEGVRMTFAMWAMFTMWFVPSSFAVHHASDPETGAPLCYHDGEPEDLERDFAAHQIVSTVDHSVDLHDYIACTIFAHLNVHTVHHIFPTIDRIYHKPILDALLKENPGHFRDLYIKRNKVAKNFWTELLPSVYRLIRERRFEPVSQ
jgi:fatty acid desaturase